MVVGTQFGRWTVTELTKQLMVVGTQFGRWTVTALVDNHPKRVCAKLREPLSRTAWRLDAFCYGVSISMGDAEGW